MPGQISVLLIRSLYSTMTSGLNCHSRLPYWIAISDGPLKGFFSYQLLHEKQVWTSTLEVLLLKIKVFEIEVFENVVFENEVFETEVFKNEVFEIEVFIIKVLKNWRTQNWTPRNVRIFGQ